MQGADRYASLFNGPLQFGCFYVVPGSHARGKTFELYVLPVGEEAIPNGPNAPLNASAVEVFGITGGNPGWTETYGWKRKGPWVDDFEKLCRSRELEIEAAKEAMLAKEQGAEEDRAKEQQKVLDGYVAYSKG